MRTIHVTFDDTDFKKVEKAKRKAGLNWHDLIMTLAKKDDVED